MKKLTLLTLAALILLPGCPRRFVDRCSGDDPHPECPNVMTADMTEPPADAGDTGEDPPDDGVDMVVPPDLGPCGMVCTDPEPFCNTDTGTCVACLTEADCAGGVCADDNTCVQCLDNTDCTDQVCDTTANTCVDCVLNDDCPDTTASFCDTATNTCTACTASDDCTHLTDTTVCDTSGAEGVCVECTGTEYEDACGGFVCDSRLKTCTDQMPEQLGLCQECVSDAQCRPGMLCIPMTFPDATDPEVGTFCLWRRDATEANGPAGACSTVRPYIDATEYTSLDMVTATMCGLAATTCPGLNDYRLDCPTASVHADCGAVGVDDAFCEMFDAAANYCTTPCLSDNDCEPGVGCDTTVAPRRCEL